MTSPPLKLKPEIKALWLEALRSGEYTQGRFVLREQNSYCCLGVLCDLFIKETGQGCWVKPSDKYGEEEVWGFSLNGSQIDTLPPQEVYDWAGSPCTTEELTLERSVEGDSLSQINDEREGFTFLDIADLIDINT